MKLALVADGVVTGIVKRNKTTATTGVWIDDSDSDVRVGWLYDGSVFTAPPAVVYTRITTEAFWERFTNSEMVDLYVAAWQDAGMSNAQKKACAKIRIFMYDANASGYRKLSANKVVTFVTGLEGTVLAVGRATVILNTPITEDEAYIK